MACGCPRVQLCHRCRCRPRTPPCAAQPHSTWGKCALQAHGPQQHHSLHQRAPHCSVRPGHAFVCTLAAAALLLHARTHAQGGGGPPCPHLLHQRQRRPAACRHLCIRGQQQGARVGSNVYVRAGSTQTAERMACVSVCTCAPHALTMRAHWCTHTTAQATVYRCLPNFKMDELQVYQDADVSLHLMWIP